MAWSENATDARPSREGYVTETTKLREQLEGIGNQLDRFERIIRGEPREEPPSAKGAQAVPPCGLSDNLSGCRGLASNIYNRLQAINDQF